MTLPYFPPSYSVRTSKRARRVNLRIRTGHGLEIILPQNTDPGVVPSVLQKFRPWIEKHYQRLCPGHSNDEEDFPHAFFLRGGHEFIVLSSFFAAASQAPKGIELENTHFLQPVNAGRHRVRMNAHAAGSISGLPGEKLESLLVKYAAQTLPPFTLERSLPHCRVVDAPVRAQGPDRLAWLQSWVREEARRVLGAQLETLSELYGFPYTRFTVRFQRTRWGSCSGKRTISLNANLLFLPDVLQEYVILHELCHTKEMNHSEAFWKHLFRVDSKALVHDKAMRKGWQYIPAWAMRQVQR